MEAEEVFGDEDAAQPWFGAKDEGRRDAPPPRDDRSDDDDGPDNLHEAFTAKLSAQIADHDHILDRPPASRKSGTALALPSTPPLPPQRWHPADSSSSFEGFHGQGNDAWEIQGGVAVPTRDAPPKRTKHIPGPDAEHDHHAAPEDVALRHWNRPPPGADHGGDRGGVRYGRLDELQGPPVPLHSGHPQATYAAPRPGPRPGSAGGHHPYATGPSGAVARLAREAVDDSDSDETAEQFHRRMARAYAAGAVPGQPRAQSREGPAEHWQHPQQHHYQQQQAQHAYAMGQRGPPPPQGGIWAACSAAPPRPPPHPAAGEYRHYQAGWQELEWHPEEPEQPHSSAERRRGFDHDQSSGPMLRPGSEQPPAHHRNDYHGTLRGYDAGDGWGGGRPGAGPRGPPAPEHSSAEQAPALRTSGGRRDGRDQRASPVTHAHDRPAVSALPEEDELAPHVVDWSTSRRPPPPMPPPLIPPPPPRPPTPLDDKPVGPGVGVAGRARTFEELLEIELQKAGEPARAEPSPSAERGSEPRPFLRKGARSFRQSPGPQARSASMTSASLDEAAFARSASKLPAAEAKPHQKQRQPQAATAARPGTAGSTHSRGSAGRSQSPEVSERRPPGREGGAVSSNTRGAALQREIQQPHPLAKPDGTPPARATPGGRSLSSGGAQREPAGTSAAARQRQPGFPIAAASSVDPPADLRRSGGRDVRAGVHATATGPMHRSSGRAASSGLDGRGRAALGPRPPAAEFEDARNPSATPRPFLQRGKGTGAYMAGARIAAAAKTAQDKGPQPEKSQGSLSAGRPSTAPPAGAAHPQGRPASQNLACGPRPATAGPAASVVQQRVALAHRPGSAAGRHSPSGLPDSANGRVSVEACGRAGEPGWAPLEDRNGEGRERPSSRALKPVVSWSGGGAQAAAGGGDDATWSDDDGREGDLGTLGAGRVAMAEEGSGDDTEEGDSAAGSSFLAQFLQQRASWNGVPLSDGDDDECAGAETPTSGAASIHIGGYRVSSTAEAASASAAQQAAAGALGLRYQFAYSDEEVEDLPASTSASASASEATGRPPAPGSRAEALLRLANKIGGARGAGAGGAGAGAAGGRTPAGAPELELESFDAVEGDVRAELAPLIARPATGVSSAPAARQQQQRQEQQTLQSAAAQICARGGQQDLPSPTKDDDEADEDAMGEPAQDVSFDDSQDWGDNTSVASFSYSAVRPGLQIRGRQQPLKRGPYGQGAEAGSGVHGEASAQRRGGSGAGPSAAIPGSTEEDGPKATCPLVQKLFYEQQRAAGRGAEPAAGRPGAASGGRGKFAGRIPKQGVNPAAVENLAAAAVAEKLAALEEDAQRLRDEARRKGPHERRQRARRRRTEDARAAADAMYVVLETEKAAWEREKQREVEALDLYKAEERRKIARDRRVLEKQSKALLKIPGRKEKSEADALRAELAQEREEARGREARHKLSLERLRKHISQLTEENEELRRAQIPSAGEEVRRAEEARLAAWRHPDAVLSSPLSGPRRHGGGGVVAGDADNTTAMGLTHDFSARNSGPRTTARQAAAAAVVTRGSAGSERATTPPANNSAANQHARSGGSGGGVGAAQVLELSQSAAALARSAGSVGARGAAACHPGGQHVACAPLHGTGGTARGAAAPAACPSEPLEVRRPRPDGKAVGSVWDPKPSVEQWEVGAAGTGQPAQEVRYDDGRVERLFVDGRKEVRFANGTRKLSAADGTSCVIFTNGDAKRTVPGGCVEYFYAEVDTWHVTHPSGEEVYFFPNGQTEAHFADSSKDILFPDGYIRRVLPDGTEKDLLISSIGAR